MKEANLTKPKENRSKPSKFSDQNQPPKSNPKGVSTNSSKLKSASTWGSNIVKGLAGERKSKLQPSTTAALPTKKPLSNPLQSINSSKVKRGLIGDLSCSVAATQVHPHTLNSPKNGNLRLLGSRDLLVEIENLRALLKESKEREFQLQTELSESKRNQRVLELEREVEAKENEVQGLVGKITLLESERTTLKEQLKSLSNSDYEGYENETPAKPLKPKSLEMEVVELRRLNKELQLQKRDLSCKIASLESQLAKSSQNEIITKIKAEASMLRHTNEDLSKQVEGLQMNRLNEVEELAYLRWVNSQLRNELRNSCSCATSEVGSSPSRATEINQTPGFPRVSDEFLECSSAKRVTLVKKLNKWPVTDEDLSSLDSPSHSVLHRRWDELMEGNGSATRRHSISGSRCSDDDSVVNKRRQSDGFMCSKEVESKEDDRLNSQRHETSKVLVGLDVEKRALRVPNPPPRPSCVTSSVGHKEAGSMQAPPAPPPPPPPPPPLRFSAANASGAVQRAPQVVEFYHSLMKRDTRRDSSAGTLCDTPNVANVKSSMIGEIENRSSYLLAIKADVETQGEFVNSLIREVNNAVYRDIEDVVAFVKWLDDELCFLVDERAVLKHFEWPEKKADTLREAAFGYKDLKKLESEVTYYRDDPRLSCDIALKKMVSLSEKIERTVYNLLRTRDSLMRSCKEFQIPVDWMLDSGIISKVKLGSVKLAKKYMNRVAIELQSRSSLEKDPALDYMLLQGVRFAFRIHQFAGGFDAETMEAFEELRRLAHTLNKR